jgi:hypothetical protein
MKKHNKISIFCLAALLLKSITGMSQQTDLQQLLKNARAQAEAIKKNMPPGKQDEGLPAGYNNSWTVSVTVNRTVTGSSHMVATNPGCRETKSSSLNFTLQASYSSDQNVGWLNGDDFQLNTYATLDDHFRRFAHPLRGGYSVDWQMNGSTGGCGSSSETDLSGNGQVDPAQLDVRFSYNKKTREGDFTVGLPEKYDFNASGKLTSSSSGNGKITTDAAAGSRAVGNLLFATCGPFLIRNHLVFGGAAVQQAVEASPVNGGMATIVETRYGYEISYSQSKTIDNKIPDGYTGSDQTTYTTTVHVSISDQNPIQYDAILQVVNLNNSQEGYDQWIPKGPPVGNKDPRNASDHGNSIGFKVIVVDKKKPDQPIPGEEYDVDYKLTYVSHEPGYCNNYPLNSPNDGKPDLKFDQQLTPKENVIYDEEEVKSTGHTGHNFIAFVTSYDYGSFGRLTATVTLKYGSKLAAHFKDDKDTTISIPKDDNNNQIADAWEKQRDVNVYQYGYNPLWDGEKQKINGKVVNNHDGDGLTLYEEYRGVVVRGEYMRLDPNKKELFVLNQIGDKAKPGMELFATASGIKVIELSAEDADKYDPVINDNSDFARGGKQHGLILKEFQNSDQSILGKTPDRTGNADAPPASPGKCSYVGINSNAHFEPGEYSVTVAHEMAHGCGVWHHGSLAAVDPPKKEDLDSSYRIYAHDMTLVSPETFEQIRQQGILPPIAGPGSQSSGDMHCLMSYYYQYVWANPKDKVFINVDHIDKSEQNRFCDSKTGTFLNAPTHKPYPVYGNAARGDCIHQFQVKDW